jgi:hypothetical protein
MVSILGLDLAIYRFIYSFGLVMFRYGKGGRAFLHGVCCLPTELCLSGPAALQPYILLSLCQGKNFFVRLFSVFQSVRSIKCLFASCAHIFHLYLVLVGTYGGTRYVFTSTSVVTCTYFYRRCVRLPYH